MPSSLFQLLVFVATASPGYVFLLTADRRRPPRQQSTFRETVEWFVIGSTSTLASLLIAVLVLLIAGVGTVDDLVFDTKAFAKDHLTAVAVGVLLVYAGACLLSWLAARWATAKTRPCVPIWNRARRRWGDPNRVDKRWRRGVAWCSQRVRWIWHDPSDPERREGSEYLPISAWEDALRETRPAQGWITLVQARVKGEDEPVFGVLKNFSPGMNPISERELTLIVQARLPEEMPGGWKGGQETQAIVVLHGSEISSLRAIHVKAYGPFSALPPELSDESS